MIRGLVSVVIPSYNYGHFVVEAVESALAQTYPEVEVLVVDDGSTDDTRDRLKPYEGRIRYIYQANQGLSAARNTGIRAARGEFIGLLDSDDVWLPDKLETQMGYATAHPEVGLVASDLVTNLQPDGLPVLPPSECRVAVLSLHDLLFPGKFSPSSVLIRRTCLDAIGLFDTSLRSSEDWDMWLRLAPQFPIVKLCVPLLWYRIHGNNISKAAARMENTGQRVLYQAFGTIPSLRRNWMIRLQAFSNYARLIADIYDSGGMQGQAFARMLKSFLLWPFPYPRGVTRRSFERLRKLAVISLRLLRLKAPAPPPPPSAPSPVTPKPPPLDECHTRRLVPL